MASKSEVVAYAEAHGLTYGGAYKRLNKDKAKEYSRRDLSRPGRAEAIRSHASELVAKCPTCGYPMPRRKQYAGGVCVECDRDRRRAERLARCYRIEYLWGLGRSLREIAEELDSTPNSIGTALARMRTEGGWNVPPRRARRRAAA